MIKKFQELIIEWAKDNSISYPWRENRTPYKVLISEILLTRTKAKQVVPVYNRFMEKYPSIKEFLEADLDNIKNLIKSLGLLYRANKIIDLIDRLKINFNNKIPNKLKELKTLPGIGDYGANAILCFGYNKKNPLIDSNFIRIFARVFNIHSKTKTAKTDKYLWEFSRNLLPEKDYVPLNYGILDLGGNICISRNPKCSVCFVNEICVYFRKIQSNNENK